MILQYSNILNEDLILKIKTYLDEILHKDVWIFSDCWNKKLTENSTKILLHQISSDNIILKSVKSSIENKLKINFDKSKWDFTLCIYLWGKMTNIAWHNDVDYDYNGTIYLNKTWDIDDGGIFLWRNNKTGKIEGIPSHYNTMVVNLEDVTDPLNMHSVTMISPNIKDDRLTLQWRACKKFTEKLPNKKIEYL